MCVIKACQRRRERSVKVKRVHLFLQLPGGYKTNQNHKLTSPGYSTFYAYSLYLSQYLTPSIQTKLQGNLVLLTECKFSCNHTSHFEHTVPFGISMLNKQQLNNINIGKAGLREEGVKLLHAATVQVQHAPPAG